MKLYCDNCFTVIPKLIEEGIKVDAVICDPPYNISQEKWDTNFDIEQIAYLLQDICKENANIIIF